MRWLTSTSWIRQILDSPRPIAREACGFVNQVAAPKHTVELAMAWWYGLQAPFDRIDVDRLTRLWMVISVGWVLVNDESRWATWPASEGAVTTTRACLQVLPLTTDVPQGATRDLGPGSKTARFHAAEIMRKV